MPKTRRRFRWLRRLVLTSVWMIAAAAVTYLIATPLIVQARIHAMLQALGVNDAGFDVASVSSGTLRLDDVRMGSPQWLTADAVRADYGIGSIWAGRVETLTISGAHYVIRVKDGQADFGPHFERREAAPAFDAPFTQVNLRDCIITLDLEGRRIAVKVDGAITRPVLETLMLDLSIATMTPVAAPVGDSMLAIDALTADVRLDVKFKQDGIVVTQREPMAIRASHLLVRSPGGADHVIESADLRIAQLPGKSLLEIGQVDGERHTAIHGAVESAQAIAFHGSGLEVIAGRIATQIALAARPSSPVEVDGIVDVTEATVAWSGQDASVRGASFSAPFSGSAGSLEAAGSFAAASVQFQGRTLPGVDGTVKMQDRAMSASLTWPFASNAALKMDGALDFSAPDLQGEILASIAPFDLVEANDLLTWLIPQLDGATVGGTWSLDGRASIQNNQIQPEIKVSASNASVAHPDWPGEVQSANGTIVLDSLWPLSTSPGQRVTVHSARVGELEISDGLIEFDMQSATLIDFGHVSWGMGELGRFSTAPFQYDAAATSLRTRISCADVGLGAWLDLLAKDKVSGEGVLRGVVDLEIRPSSRQKFEIQEGVLYASPETGWIEVYDAETLTGLLEQSEAAFAADTRLNEVKNRVVAALQQFEFTMFRVQLVPQPGDTVLCRIETRGKGRRGENPQEIGGLVINVHNFDGLMRTAILGRSLWDATE